MTVQCRTLTMNNEGRSAGVFALIAMLNISLFTIGNIVRLSPADSDSPIRTFYLRLTEEQDAEAWAQMIREARFDVVREERDALRSAKAVMTEQVIWWDGRLPT